MKGNASRSKGYRLLNLETGAIDEAIKRAWCCTKSTRWRESVYNGFSELVYRDKVNPKLTLPVKLPVIRLAMIELPDDSSNDEEERLTRAADGQSAHGAARPLTGDSNTSPEGG